VFEQEPLYGGLMQTIPAYRMTDADVEEDRARLRNLDVTFVKNRKIGADFSPEHLLEEGYQAVFLSVGTSVHRTLGVEGENLPGVIPALELLKRVNRGEPVTLGTKIIVIGGGDVAMDSVRSALRLSHGGHVSLYYRRSREEMPADPEEVHGAMAEGIEFVFQKAPLKIVGDGRAEGVVFQSIELGPPDAGGRRAPVPVPGSETTIPCDTVVVAVGQKADLGWPEGKAPGFATAIPGVFAAGGRSVVYAMGTATDAAIAIDAYLASKRGEAPTPRPDPFGGPTTYHLPAGYTTPIRA
jgi:NADPH-dependent glutamate synthase beta subunit-like oxidoreductase